MNQRREVVLHVYTSQPKCNDWHKQLLLIELAYRSTLNESTGFTHFQLLYNQLQSIIERLLTPRLEESDEATPAELLAQGFMNDTANQIKDAQLALQCAFGIQKGNQTRRYGPLPAYAAGDYATVLLKSHPIAALLTHKLGPQRFSPFKILRTLSGSRSVELDFPYIGKFTWSCWSSTLTQHLTLIWAAQIQSLRTRIDRTSFRRP